MDCGACEPVGPIESIFYEDDLPDEHSHYLQINADFFAPLSLAIASNENAIKALQGGAGAATDLNLARASMNLGFALELMAETMCAGVIALRSPRDATRDTLTKKSPVDFRPGSPT